ncbi:MAG: redoxin domain-containing protein [Ignavibacteriales bacterium]|nr:redoxin domain-containing protein [Ignavibacteriaceae bacterium]QOJ29057.1 MAG: redoxin domain-containing protein [Ignavibacteriales bacterium]
MSLSVGSPAPDFSLHCHKGGKVTLSELKGQNVVLLFFPFANTGVCTKEMCTFRDGMSVYNDLNAKVIGISVDSPFSLALWAEKNGLQFDLLSDFNKTTIKDYDSVFDVFGAGKWDFAGVSKRSAFVVDKDGIIRYMEILPSPGDEPNYDAIKKTVESLS